MKIRTYDGGGALGVVSARFVQRIDERVPGFADSADFNAGTSAGSLNAAARAIRLPPGEVVDMFRDLGPQVFRSRDWMDRWTGSIDEAFRADYSLDPLVDLVRRTLGRERMLSDLDSHFMAVLFNLDNGEGRWKPKFVHTWGDGDWALWAACVGSCAAPTYFPSLTAPHDGREYVDGGLVNNNPSMSALAKALKTGVRLEDVRLISFGTGAQKRAMKGGDLGLKQWISGGRLLNVIFDGLAGVPDYQCAQLLGRYDPRHKDHDPDGRYVRLDLVLEDPVEMDDAKALPDLVKKVDEFDLGWVVDWVNEKWLPKQVA